MPLESEIRAYEARRDELERLYTGQYVVFHGDEFVGAFDDLNAAAEEAIRRFGSGPYLIRQVGMSSVTPVAALHLL